ncbi:Prolyl 3-hydroxylase OGFOD1 [Blattella germanica]|nr:Prolyl 3-hydroxylase OGFOD1 [Blattella germanica]
MSLKRKNAGSSKCGPNAKQRCEIKAALNDAITECVDDMKTCWNSRESFDKGNIHFSATPFRYCLIENFLSDGNFLKDLKAEVGDANLKKKRNDLYQFHQSSDLSAMNKPVSNSFRKFLKEKCKPWLEKITDHLLCHDDKCDDRRIAFILYLSENWLPECGGSLQLFDAEADSEPITVVKDIQPVFNSFVFFEVSRKSHHQVCEVTSMDRTRLSVNGWFHGSLPDGEVEEDYYSSPFKLERFPPSIVESRLSKYVNKMYLQPAAQKQILEVFSRESEILLPDFIETSFYNELCECLASESLSWKMDGPPNRR